MTDTPPTSGSDGETPSIAPRMSGDELTANQPALEGPWRARGG
jgi:hypothetical protein